MYVPESKRESSLDMKKVWRVASVGGLSYYRQDTRVRGATLTTQLAARVWEPPPLHIPGS
jgi:hypothetical protein